MTESDELSPNLDSKLRLLTEVFDELKTDSPGVLKKVIIY